VLGDSLYQVVCAIAEGETLTVSQRTSLMVYVLKYSILCVWLLCVEQTDIINIYDNIKIIQSVEHDNSAQLELMFELVELDY
jgi:hypothetical protein